MDYVFKITSVDVIDLMVGAEIPIKEADESGHHEGLDDFRYNYE